MSSYWVVKAPAYWRPGKCEACNMARACKECDVERGTEAGVCPLGHAEILRVDHLAQAQSDKSYLDEPR